VRRLASLIAVAFLCVSCASSEPHDPKPPKHKTWDDDDGPSKTDFPERTTPERTTQEPRDADAIVLPKKPPAPVEARRPNVKVELTVVEVISWDEVKIRGGVRGSIVRGVVSLTEWLKDGKSKAGSKRGTSQSVVVESGHEASIELQDPALRALVGDCTALRVAVLDANDRGEIDVSIAPLAAGTDEGQIVLATRVRVAPGEALVVGGHRSEDEAGPPAGKHDQLVVLTATAVR
jgi:hypothetical protein